VTHLLTVDHVLRGWIVAHRLPLVDDMMWTLSAAGRAGMVWIVMGIFIALRRAAWSVIGTLTPALLLAWILADVILKPVIGRERPFVQTPAVRVIGGKPADASFPSGHAASSFAAAAVLSVMAPVGRLVWWPLAIAIACSRVYLGVHYPLDVVAGAGVGLASASAVLALKGMVVRHPA
jgi:undecaprenyl-diphosphatase